MAAHGAFQRARFASETVSPSRTDKYSMKTYGCLFAAALPRFDQLRITPGARKGFVGRFPGVSPLRRRNPRLLSDILSGCFC
jgi:hypothetical protein